MRDVISGQLFTAGGDICRGGKELYTYKKGIRIKWLNEKNEKNKKKLYEILRLDNRKIFNC